MGNNDGSGGTDNGNGWLSRLWGGTPNTTAGDGQRVVRTSSTPTVPAEVSKDLQASSVISASAPENLTEEDIHSCIKLLRKSYLFSQCSDKNLRRLAKGMFKFTYPAGAVVMDQDQPQTRMVVINRGEVERSRRDSRGRTQIVAAGDSDLIFGGTFLMRTDPSYSTLICTSPEGLETFELTNSHLRKVMRARPVFSEEIVASLSLGIRQGKTMRTPLLRQEAYPFPVFATTVGSSVEAFYRSAMNALVNRAIYKTKEAMTLRHLFPSMHVQVPVRMMYFNGFKGIRGFLQHVFPEHDLRYSGTGIRLAIACAPGIAMTPVVSFLEACNAHRNPEPLYRRWQRGVLPRGVREVIFGLGLNQLTDFCEERLPDAVSPFLRNMIGSLTAGGVAGYLSHVPHNLSTLKLMEPNKSYAQHMQFLIDGSERRLPTNLPASLKRPFAAIGSIIAPVGVAVRTMQVMGSFIILNGIIHLITYK